MTSRNKVCHLCLHRQFKLVTLYAIVTFLKALMSLSPVTTACGPSSHPSPFLSLLLPSILSFPGYAIPTSTTPIMCCSGTAARTQCLDMQQDGALRQGCAEHWLGATLPSLGGKHCDWSHGLWGLY